MTKKLFRKCPCPVLAKRSSIKTAHERILAAVDVGSSAPDESPPNTRVLELAASLARNAKCPLSVFHAWSLWNESYLRGRGGLSSAQIDSAREQEEQERKKRVEELIAAVGVDGVDVQIELSCGDPRSLLPAVVLEKDVDLVVMGSVSRGGVLGMLIGNTAEKVLNELSCSVLAVKPEGFVSPIEP